MRVSEEFFAIRVINTQMANAINNKSNNNNCFTVFPESFQKMIEVGNDNQLNRLLSLK
jgi:hypothetical protein